MINLPLDKIIRKIKDESGLSEEEITKRIKSKLDELAGLISEEGAAHIIANELGVKLLDASSPLTVDKIVAGLRNVELVGKVRQAYEVREFSTDRRSGKVGSFMLQDPTGVMRVVLWNDNAQAITKMKQGDVVKVKGGYARDNNGRLELHVSENSGKIYINPEGVKVDVDVNEAARPVIDTKKIAELNEQDQNVSVIATIVQVFDPRFFPVCSECGGKVQEQDGGYVCKTHGVVTPNFSYVINIYLDDASDNVRCVLWRDQAAKLLSKSHEEMISMKDDPGAFDKYKTDLLGMIVKVRGRVNKNESFGRLELIGYDVETDVDPVDEASSKETPLKADTVIKTEEKTDVVLDDNKVESVKSEKEEQVDSDEVFTLEDLEDLDD